MKTFSDDTLRAAREKLLARGALLVERIQQVKADRGRAEEPLPPDAPDAAIVREDGAMLLAIEKSAHAEISRIEAALERLEVGTFGLCEECGKEIEAARFIALPEATRYKICASDG